MNKTINQYIEESIKRNFHHKALSDVAGVTITYQQLAAEVAKWHIIYRECGLNEGDKVALCAKNSAQWAIAFFSVITYGAVPVPLLHEFKPDNLHHLVNHSDSKVFFVDDKIWKTLDPDRFPKLKAVVKMSDFSLLKCADNHIAQVHGDADKLMARQYPSGFSADDVHYSRPQAEDLAIINYTSGSTGNSKGVMIPHRALSSNMQFAIEHLTFLHPGDGMVCILPLAHMYGLMFDLIHGIVKGCHVHFITRSLAPKTILEAFHLVKPKLIITVPLIIEKIIKGKVFPLLATPKMKFMLKVPLLRQMLLGRIKEEIIKVFGGNVMQIIVGGAAVNHEVEQFLNSIKFPITVGYGMTECAPLLAYAPWDETKSGSCGRLVDRMQMRIDSPDPATIAGELWIKGDNVMLGYFHNEEATSSVMHDGWMNTGDLCNVDADGLIFIRGRSKNMILGPSGQNIYPEEIEQVVNEQPYVVESVVIEENGRIIALIYPDYDTAKSDGLEGDALAAHIKKSIAAANNSLPTFSRVADIRLREQEFEKTPKRSIKRFLYQH